MKRLLNKILEPEHTALISTNRFTNKDLAILIIPILAERLLSMLIGITDTLMISYAGEAAVSGVSLVNQMNNVFIFVFGAVATGGGVIVSQYIGKGRRENSVTAASQFIMLTITVSIIMMIVLIVIRNPLLNIMFGNVETKVMEAARIYLSLSVLSFPALAISNSGAALFRSMGKSTAILSISALMNITNIILNYVGIFVVHGGVAGVAISSLISRIAAAIITIIMLANKNNTAYIRLREVFMWNGAMIKRIAKVAWPNGVETGLFQIAKVALAGIIALFGTTQIAANAVAQNLWSIGSLFCIAMGYAFVTVIGQCIGSGNIDEADYYNKKLLRVTYIGSAIWNALIIAIMPLMLSTYQLTEETRQLTVILVIMLSLFNTALCPLDFSLSSGLKAAGDVKYIMFASIIATVICRVFFSFLFGVQMNMGIIGVGLAIICDRFVKAALVSVRYCSGKWSAYKLI